MRFILIDRIVSLAPGEEIAAERLVQPDDDYFADHFPGFPVVPGVLLTEMMAQAAGKCLDAERRPRGKAMLARILSASFRRWVRPGDHLTIHAKVVANADAYATAECQVSVGEAVAAQAKLFFSFLPAAQLAAGFRDDILEDFLARHKP
jgi:3-hydroxyacyl-[acyl-carrier-protein] dehydratase